MSVVILSCKKKTTSLSITFNQGSGHYSVTYTMDGATQTKDMATGNVLKWFNPEVGSVSMTCTDKAGDVMWIQVILPDNTSKNFSGSTITYNY